VLFGRKRAIREDTEVNIQMQEKNEGGYQVSTEDKAALTANAV
jgi:hypothetical protein